MEGERDLGCPARQWFASRVDRGRCGAAVERAQTVATRPTLDHCLAGSPDTIDRAGDVDLVLSSGNTMMHVSTEDHPAVLASLAGALKPGGVISFESRNPAPPCSSVRRRRSPPTSRTPGFGTIDIRGGWRGESLTEDSRLLVFRAAKLVD